MTLQKICLWKKVFSTRPDELPDAMFLQNSSDCFHCSGNDELCPDYVQIWEDATPEVMRLKYKENQGFNLSDKRFQTSEQFFAGDGKVIYEEEDVKEFIKRAKAPIEAELKFIEKNKESEIAKTVRILFEQVLRNINELAGSKLTSNEPEVNK